jgi:hypothetical protein
MQTKLNQAQLFRKTAAKLIKQAELLEAGIDIRQCVHGEYTNEPFTGCKTCGNPKVVICSHEKITGKKRNGKLCNPQGCKYFTSRKHTTDN